MHKIAFIEIMRSSPILSFLTSAPAGVKLLTYSFTWLFIRHWESDRKPHQKIICRSTRL